LRGEEGAGTTGFGEACEFYSYFLFIFDIFFIIVVWECLLLLRGMVRLT
jgi:hypothetical protein